MGKRPSQMTVRPRTPRVLSPEDQERKDFERQWAENNPGQGAAAQRTASAAAGIAPRTHTGEDGTVYTQNEQYGRYEDEDGNVRKPPSMKRNIAPGMVPPTAPTSGAPMATTNKQTPQPRQQPTLQQEAAGADPKVGGISRRPLVQSRKTNWKDQEGREFSTPRFETGYNRQDIADSLTDDYATKQREAERLQGYQEAALDVKWDSANRIPGELQGRGEEALERTREGTEGRERAGLRETAQTKQAAQQLGPQAQQRAKDTLGDVARREVEAKSQFTDDTAIGIERARKGLEASFKDKEAEIVAQYAGDSEGMNAALQQLSFSKMNALGGIATEARMSYNKQRNANEQFWGQLSTSARLESDKLTGLAERGGAEEARGVDSIRMQIRNNADQERIEMERAILGLDTQASVMEANGLADWADDARNMQSFLVPAAPFMMDLYELSMGALHGSTVGGSGGGGGSFGVSMSGGGESSYGLASGNSEAREGAMAMGGGSSPTREQPTKNPDGSVNWGKQAGAPVDKSSVNWATK